MSEAGWLESDWPPQHYAVWLLTTELAHAFAARAKERRFNERGYIADLARALRVLKTSPVFITEESAKELLIQQRWKLAQSSDSAEYWQSPRGTETVLFPLRKDFIDYRKCLVAVVRDVYEDARWARRRRG